MLKFCERLVDAKTASPNLVMLRQRLEGLGELFVSRAYSTPSTKEVELSQQEGGRIGGSLSRQSAKVTEPVTPLDALKTNHGAPDFIKSGVEGYEGGIFTGLTRPVGMACFMPNLAAFDREAVRCVTRLAAFARMEFNFPTTEPPKRFSLDGWLAPK